MRDDHPQPTALNVLGNPLAACSTDPLTGFMREGDCTLAPQDQGQHTVCAQMTAAFLAFTAARGNDLSTPVPHFGFPGLQPGDRWCLGVFRWMEACEVGLAPPIILAATDSSVLQFVPLETLIAHAIDAPPNDESAG